MRISDWSSDVCSSDLTVDIIDVGGGFPSVYPGMEPPALEYYFDAIDRAFESLPISYSAELWCEPGRALSAEYSSLIVRVARRRGSTDARLVGKECVRTCSSRWSPDH